MAASLSNTMNLRSAVVLLLPLLVLASCRGDTLDQTGEVEVSISVAPTPPIEGPARLVVTVTDPVDGPIEGAEVWIEGVMAHPGMIPVHVEAVELGEGTYAVQDFDFTMSGDWILITRVWLEDDTELVSRQEVRVVSGGPANGS
jgi:hypothetical protein